MNPVIRSSVSLTNVSQPCGLSMKKYRVSTF